MIISRRNGQLVLVDQVEHARLCGTFVEPWGNAAFARVTALESTRLAAALHDHGWAESDDRPLFNPEARRPLHFLELDRAAHVRLYAEGVEQAYRRDPYTGLLVSMHWTGLYRSRWGMASGRVERTDPAPEDAVIDAEERRWSQVKHELCHTHRRSDLEISLWHNYDLLQAWDLLSLFVCLMDLSPASSEEPRPVSAVLANIDQPPGPRTIPAVPRAAGGERVELTLTPIDLGVVQVAPFPFDGAELECRVAARLLPDQAYEDEAAGLAALAAARRETIVCRLVR
jgi:hypothetical protein